MHLLSPMTIRYTSTNTPTNHRTPQVNYQQPSINASHYSYLTNKHLTAVYGPTRTRQTTVASTTHWNMHHQWNRNEHELGNEKLYGLTHHITTTPNTNIGRNFLNLIDKHFPTNQRLHKLFNRNTVNVSYSCMINVRSDNTIQRSNNQER